MQKNLKYKQLLWVIIILTPLSGLGVDIYMPGMLQISHQLHAEYNLVQYSISTYLLGFGLSQLFYGIAYDYSGIKRHLLAGLFLYLIATLVIIILPDIHALLYGRFFQGAGVAAASVGVRTLMSNNYDNKKRVIVAGYVSSAWSLGPILAPFIGSFLIHHFSHWQSIFYFMFIYTSILVMIILFTPIKDNISKNNFKQLAGGTKNMLTSLTFIASLCATICIYSTFILFAFLSSGYFQQVLHISLISCGLIFLTLGIAFFIGSLLSKVMIAHYNKHLIIIISGLINLLISCYLFYILIYQNILLDHIIISACIIFIVNAISYPIYFALSLQNITSNSGIYSAITGTIYFVASSLISMFAGVFKTETLLPLGSFYLAFAVTICLSGLIIFFKERTP